LVAPQSSIVIGSREISVLGVACFVGMAAVPAIPAAGAAVGASTAPVGPEALPVTLGLSPVFVGAAPVPDIAFGVTAPPRFPVAAGVEDDEQLAKGSSIAHSANASRVARVKTDVGMKTRCPRPDFFMIVRAAKAAHGLRPSDCFAPESACHLDGTCSAHEAGMQGGGLNVYKVLAFVDGHSQRSPVPGQNFTVSTKTYKK
jgi:hypothetical protein